LLQKWKAHCLTGFKVSQEQQREVAKKARAISLRLNLLGFYSPPWGVKWFDEPIYS